MKKLFLILFVFLVPYIITGCGGSSKDESDTFPIQLTSGDFVYNGIDQINNVHSYSYSFGIKNVSNTDCDFAWDIEEWSAGQSMGGDSPKHNTFHSGQSNTLIGEMSCGYKIDKFVLILTAGTEIRRIEFIPRSN